MELSDVICHPLCKIFETSIKTSCIPDDWKDAKISAIYKNMNKKVASNYRPIILTSIVCKCMEKIVRNHVTSERKWSFQSKTVWLYFWQIYSLTTNNHTRYMDL